MVIKQKTTGKLGSTTGLNQFKAEIEARAKEIYLKRQVTKTPGDALSDWLMAEKEIKAKYNIA